MNTTKIVAYEKSHVALMQAELPELGANDVLLKTLYSTISPGTELAWLNHMENTPGVFPYVPGYSACCRVEETGADVSSLSVGDTVAALVIHSSMNVLSAEKCITVSQNIQPCEASAYRLASISLQGIRKADIQIGDDVAVLGLGTIGNYAAQLAHVAGAGSVSGFEPIAERREIAKKCGIRQLYRSGTLDEFESKFDVVIDATGAPDAVNIALQMIKPLGRIVALGSSRGLTNGVDFYRDIHRKGITIIGAHEMHRSRDKADRFGHFRNHLEDDRTVLRLLEAGRITLAPLISTVVAPQQAQDIYNRLLIKKDRLISAAFDWNKLEE